jgi:hypothetical protein
MVALHSSDRASEQQGPARRGKVQERESTVRSVPCQQKSYWVLGNITQQKVPNSATALQRAEALLGEAPQLHAVAMECQPRHAHDVRRYQPQLEVD